MFLWKLFPRIETLRRRRIAIFMHPRRRFQANFLIWGCLWAIQYNLVSSGDRDEFSQQSFADPCPKITPSRNPRPVCGRHRFRNSTTLSRRRHGEGFSSCPEESSARSGQAVQSVLSISVLGQVEG